MTFTYDDEDDEDDDDDDDVDDVDDDDDDDVDVDVDDEAKIPRICIVSILTPVSSNVSLIAASDGASLSSMCPPGNETCPL